jgi:MoaA/NifB/PqqE/SkfB family radical SAM enzyme
MSPEEIANIFKQLRKVDVFRITGGEPFLRDDLDEVVNQVEAVNPPELVHFTTNGLLTERIVKAMDRIGPIEKVHIKVSIDSVGEAYDKIRGVKGAYEKAMKTVRSLVDLRERKPLHVGVNQAIVSEDEIDSYYKLKEILGELGVPIYPSIAFDATNSLYSKIEMVDPALSFKPFGEFSKEKLREFFKVLLEDGKKVNNFQERLVDRYHVGGLQNRLVEGKMKPNPRCVALNDHLRILPNGDVPVCLYNGRIVGNLREESFESIWFGEKIKPHRNWVRKCEGCWQSCESVVSAAYTGDIWKGFLH